MTIIRNQVAFRMLAEQIERHPENYQQETWSTTTAEDLVNIVPGEIVRHGGYNYRALPKLSCGSHACLAGNVVTLAGWQLLVDADEWNDAIQAMHNSHYEEVSVGAAVRDGYTTEVPIAAFGVLYGVDSVKDPDFPQRGLEDILLFDGDWRPREGMSVPDALRALADGETLESVSNTQFVASRADRFMDLYRHDIELSRDVPEGMIL